MPSGDHLLQHGGELGVHAAARTLDGCGDGGVFVHRPGLADGGLDQLGLDEGSPIGDRVVGIEYLKGTDGVDLTDGERHIVGRFPLGRRGQQARRLSRKVESGVLAEAQIADLGQQALLSETLGDLRGPDVRGLGQNLRGGEMFCRVRFGVMEDRAVQRHRVRYGEIRVRVDQAVLERGGEGNQLEHRTRLVELRHGIVVRRLVDRGPWARSG